MSSEKQSLDVPRDTEPPTSRASTLAEDHVPESHAAEKLDEVDADKDAGLKDDLQKDEAQNDKPAADVLAEDEYPHGAKLLAIVVALILSIFLVALDLVRQTPLKLRKSHQTDSPSDHRRHCYPQDHR